MYTFLTGKEMKGKERKGTLFKVSGKENEVSAEK